MLVGLITYVGGSSLPDWLGYYKVIAAGPVRAPGGPLGRGDHILSFRLKPPLTG